MKNPVQEMGACWDQIKKDHSEGEPTELALFNKILEFFKAFKEQLVKKPKEAAEDTIMLAHDHIARVLDFLKTEAEPSDDTTKLEGKFVEALRQFPLLMKKTNAEFAEILQAKHRAEDAIPYYIAAISEIEKVDLQHLTSEEKKKLWEDEQTLRFDYSDMLYKIAEVLHRGGKFQEALTKFGAAKDQYLQLDDVYLELKRRHETKDRFLQKYKVSERNVRDDMRKDMEINPKKYPKKFEEKSSPRSSIFQEASENRPASPDSRSHHPSGLRRRGS